MTKVAAGVENPAGMIWSCAFVTGTATQLLPHSWLGMGEELFILG